MVDMEEMEKGIIQLISWSFHYGKTIDLFI